MEEKVKKSEKSFKRGLLLLVGLFAVIFVVGVIYSVQVKKPREADVYLVPTNYHGAVEVQFNQASQPEAEKEGQHMVYHIPKDGILKVSTEAPNSGVAKDKYYYVDQQGKRTELTYGTNVHGVFFGQNEKEPMKSSFFVGTEDEWHAWNLKMNQEKIEKKKNEPRRYY
jgi:hypothetical protein